MDSGCSDIAEHSWTLDLDLSYFTQWSELDGLYTFVLSSRHDDDLDDRPAFL